MLLLEDAELELELELDDELAPDGDDEAAGVAANDEAPDPLAVVLVVAVTCVGLAVVAVVSTVR